MAYENNKRKYIRTPFQKKINYKICYNNFKSENIEATSDNVSEGGILFKTKWPPPSYAIIAINLDYKKLSTYINENNISADFNVKNLVIKNNMIYGEVIRIKEYPESGFYDVALRFIHKNEKK